MGNPAGSIGLLIPDLAARVTLLQFEVLPNGRQELDSLVRWRMREFLPYPAEEARISYQVLANHSGAAEVLGIAVRDSVLAEYEAALEGIDVRHALALPASVVLLPLIAANPSGQLLLHWCPGALTLVVLTQSRVLYWRTRPLEEGAEGSVEEVGREAGRVLATCQDHWNLKSRTWGCIPACGGQGRLSGRWPKPWGSKVRDLPGTKAPSDTLPAGDREVLERGGTPFEGLAANTIGAQ